MSEEYWAHQFTRLGNPEKIGEEQTYMNTTTPVMAQRMVCVHCHVEYVRNKDPQPTGSCPARNTKREMKRLKNG